MPRPYNDAVMTAAGAALLDKVRAGLAAIEFTRMVTGDGTYTAEEKISSALRECAGLKSSRNSYALSSVSTVSGGGVKLTALFTDQDPVTGEVLVTEGYYINEIGLYAKEKDADDSTEVLYSITVAAGDIGDYMPAYTGGAPVQIVQEYRARVSDAETVSITSAGAVMLVEDAQREFEDLKRMIDEGGALGDRTLTFERAEERDNIASGETLDVILGKIEKNIADLKNIVFTASYNDLMDKPDIPTVPDTLPADGGNADTVDGFHASQSNIADTAVVRNTDGSVQLGDIIADTPDDEDPIVSQILVTNGSDGRYRKSSLAHLKSSLGIAHMDRYFSYVCGNGSTGLRSGYLNFMEFNTVIYDDWGIVFTIMTRSGSMARLRLMATNDNSPDPDISTFQCTSVLKGITPTDGMEVQVFLAKTATNTWNLYAYTTRYGSLAVSGFFEKSIIPKRETLSSLPTGYRTPTSVSYIP